MIGGAPADLVGVIFVDEAGVEQTRLAVVFGERAFLFPEELSRAKIHRAPKYLEQPLVARFAAFKNGEAEPEASKPNRSSTKKEKKSGSKKNTSRRRSSPSSV